MTRPTRRARDEAVEVIAATFLAELTKDFPANEPTLNIDKRMAERFARRIARALRRASMLKEGK
jgi:hypothetical protein